MDQKNLVQSTHAPYRSNFSFSPREGEIYYFRWKNQNSPSFGLFWKMTNKTPQEGKTSEMPKTIPIDKQVEFNPQTGIDFWYEFKADSTGYLKFGISYDANFKIEVWEKLLDKEVPVYYKINDWEPDYYYFNYKKDVDYIIRVRHQ
ncbi:hypothetical protein [Alkalitalea saponilacus]|uniref:Uncharacterized protein n=1 Tax=Alkalitalea saponilacus TaxID=889453 RepID=A0A1T5HSV7_9BACT|nr:hypothetical protein [Alkalitalea saponilacus]ASB47686.1 hypothetical protein CDL62_00215 [Alkalitalea saponilacus]SKC23611.1 hypothetical protein SAMN03080601_02890 [Alkalitalea saponilacus]